MTEKISSVFSGQKTEIIINNIVNYIKKRIGKPILSKNSLQTHF